MNSKCHEGYATCYKEPGNYVLGDDGVNIDVHRLLSSVNFLEEGRF